MKITQSLFLLLFLFHVNLVHAQKIVETKKFSISLPAEWTSAEKLFGLPYVFMGPKKLDKRATLSVVPTKNDKIVLNGALSKTAQEVYELRRKLWVEKHKGKVIKFYPYKKQELKNLGTVHEFGLNYTLGKNAFIEKSYYFYCGKSLVHTKSLVLEKDKNGQEQLNTTFSSIRCK